MAGAVRTAAVIAATNEVSTLRHLLQEVKQLNLDDVLVVANGADDEPARTAEGAGARVLRFYTPVGHDVVRGLGARETTAATVLFLDADLPVSAGDLVPFVRAVNRGVDLALNKIDPFISPQARLHPVHAAKRFLNCALGRRDLGCASLTAVPHALSRRAIERLGPATLAVPPLAQACAVRNGLRVEAIHPVDVNRPNAKRPGLNTGPENLIEQLILGDHLEALRWLLQRESDPRGGFTDLWRDRKLLQPSSSCPPSPTPDTSEPVRPPERCIQRRTPVR